MRLARRSARAGKGSRTTFERQPAGVPSEPAIATCRRARNRSRSRSRNRNRNRNRSRNRSRSRNIYDSPTQDRDRAILNAAMI